MNIMKLIVPKSMTSFLEEDCTLRQGLEKMRYHGYTAIPVLNSDALPPLRIDAGMAQIVMDIMERNFAPVVDDRNKFVGIVTRRDVLRYLSDSYFRVNDTL